MLCKRIAPLLPFVDPVSRLTVGHLGRGLRLHQQAATTGTSVELEVRLGRHRAGRRLSGGVLPVESRSMAVLGAEGKHLYKFQAGIPAESFEALLEDLARTGLTRVTASGAELTHDRLILHTRQGRRLRFQLTEDAPAAPAAAPTLRQQLMSDTAVRFSPAAASGGHEPVGSHGRLSTRRTQTARLVGVVAKRKAGIADGDVSCPEWAADLRFDLATEEALTTGGSPNCSHAAPGAAGDAAGLVEGLATDSCIHARVQRRAVVMLPPYFRLELSTERFSADVRPFEEALRPHISPAALSSATRASAAAPICFTLPRLHAPTLTHHVEVEVLLPVVLRDWKRYHGALSVPPESAEEGGAGGGRPVDPFLFQVAQDLLTLLQFLSARR